MSKTVHDELRRSSEDRKIMKYLAASMTTMTSIQAPPICETDVLVDNEAAQEPFLTLFGGKDEWEKRASV